MQPEELSFSVHVAVITPHGGGAPFVDANVQVWNGDQHVTSIKLINDVRPTMPDQMDLVTAEHYASVCTRIAARLLEDLVMERIANGTVTTKESIALEHGQ